MKCINLLKTQQNDKKIFQVSLEDQQTLIPKSNLKNNKKKNYSPIFLMNRCKN